MICQPEKIDAYLDGELSPADLAVFEDHMRSCAACSSETLARWQLKRSIRAAARQFQPSPELRARIARQIKPTRTLLFRPGQLTVLAALIVAAIAIPLYLRHAAQRSAMAEFLDLHVATLASANPVDVISSDRHTVKPWFQGKLPFTFNIPDLTNSDFKLIGGKMIYFDDHPGAQLLFALRQHRFSVFILQNTAPALGGKNENGFRVEAWNRDGLTYTIISDAAAADTRALAGLLRGGQSQ